MIPFYTYIYPYIYIYSDDEVDEEYGSHNNSRVASGSELQSAVVEAVSASDPSATSSRVPRRAGVSHVAKVDSANKVKKVKPPKVEKFSSPPFADATADAYEVCCVYVYIYNI